MTAGDPGLEAKASEAAAPQATWETMLESLGERLNPILIKEARQALKSRQFVITFTLLLLCAWGWSLLGIMLLSPWVYYSPGGRFMLVGYVVVLIVPLLVIVPFAAFRSLASEREDGTFELLSITTLKSRQIVTGKLGSAILQMMVYFSALSPCIAFTYLLRGMDVLTIALILGYTFCASLFAASVGLLVATVTRSLAWQVFLSVILLAGLMFLTFMWAGFILTFLQERPPLDDADFWVVNLAAISVFVSFVLLFVFAAAGQISFASDNRSTKLRVIMLAQQVLWIGWMTYVWLRINDFIEPLLAMFCFAAGYWMLMGSLLCGESAELSPRVKRKLPQSFLGRMTLTWFNPGSGTGYVFAVANVLAMVILLITVRVFASELGLTGNFDWNEFVFIPVLGAYVCIYLGIGRLVFRFARRLFPLGILMSVLINAFLITMGCLIPFFFQLWWQGFRAQPVYTLLQLPNWYWTLGAIMEDDLTVFIPNLPNVLIALAGGVFFINLVLAVREVEQTRVETPDRVLAESRPAAAKTSIPVNPFEDVDAMNRSSGA